MAGIGEILVVNGNTDKYCQHCTLPLIPDINFIIYRGLAFLPFAAIIGISIYYRPSLFAYFAVLHGVMDFGTVLMFLVEK